MEPQPASAAPGLLARLSSRLDWYRTLSPPGRAAFWATFGGWAIDANQMILGLVLPAITAAFALSTTQAGLTGTVSLVTSAVSGALAGALADTIGRVRVLAPGKFSLQIQGFPDTTGQQSHAIIPSCQHHCRWRVSWRMSCVCSTEPWLPR